MTLVHRLAAIAALALVLLFWSATVVSELTGDMAAVAAVKRAIAWGLLLLVPAMIAANASGLRLAASRRRPGHGLPPLLARKQRRGITVAVIGLLVLVPCALWLAAFTVANGPQRPEFFVVQGVELVAGAFNATLLILNARDGFRMRTHGRGAGQPV